MKRLALTLSLLLVASVWAETVVFSDYKTQHPGVMHHITVADLPKPDFDAGRVANGAFPTRRPHGAMPQVPPGFKVEEFAHGLKEARKLITAPNGDVFLAESGGGDVRVFRGQQSEVFASHLNHVYGMAFYPPGENPQWLYVSNTSDVYRLPYRKGDMKADAAPEHITKLPDTGGHWTRDLAFSADGKKLYVAVGSRSNIGDDASETNRADILEFNPDGTGQRIYASGIRNAGAGLAIQPGTGQLWCSSNERDGMGDNLPPDYITHVPEGGFFGWPWYYMGDHPDPRMGGKHPELASKVLVPDVLLQAHNAALQLAFYTGKMFPKEYQGDIFCCCHGSWNRSVRTGYELVRVPMHGKIGEYEDFMTGFVTSDGNVWGRPVGVTVAADGALLVSDDMSNHIWRISYTGP